MPGKSTLMKLKENERDARKNLIIDAAITLFAQKSFKDVSMRDIAGEAGISPASIYRYFSDRDELFIEAFLREARKIGDSIEKLLRGSEAVTLEQVAAEFVSRLLSYDSFFQMMTYFMMDGVIGEKFLKRFNETVERYVLSLFDDVFKKAGVTENLRLVSHAFFASLNGILITFRKYPGRDEEEIEKHMLRLAFLVAKIFKKGAL